MLSKEKIIDELNKLGVPPIEIHFYECADSTNTRAKEWAKYSAEKKPAVFIANEQTAGRGRRGRSFVSEKGAGIYISILTYPEESGADATATTARAAVTLAKATESLSDCDIKIKWVNDLYLGGKKLAGILTEGEMDKDGKVAYQVVGMGINVYKNAISDEISDIATSIEGVTGRGVDRSKLAAAIIKYHLYYNGDFYTEYKSRSFIIGKKVTVMKLSESYEAKVVDIDSDFSLIIERDGKQERLFTGEISLKI
ncbi:MAG: biotin--[Clostridia bacterium]|nr:biotin--[acetyl-CoA-carboxylase] ligase [Clostridia bacterium]